VVNLNNFLKELESKFKEIKELGWVKSIQKGHGGIGVTFEDLLGIENNSLEIPDYNGIEIKTKRDYSKSFITLFNMTPTGKYYHEIERLLNEYGYPDINDTKFKVLNNSVISNRRTCIGTNYQFMLKVDKIERKIYLCIFDKLGYLIEKNIYWDFDLIKEKLYRKMKIIALISATRKFINKDEYFKYYKMEIFYLKDFETFINLIEDGIIRINFKIGVFKNGKRIGQIHDHGTSFNIKKEDFNKLYNKYNTII
jgi:hypothetical protein